MSQAQPFPLVSVVIVSWNAWNFLRQCLESLTADVCRYPMEIIVVDNASTDGSPTNVELHFPQVRLIRNGENLGFAKANNVGIAASRGRYLCLVNSDVRVLKDCITSLLDYCEIHPEVGMAGPRVIGGDGKLQRSCRGFPTLWNMLCRATALDRMFPGTKLFCGYSLSYWEHNTRRPVDILSGCFWLVRKAAIRDVGLLDESFFMYGEDMDWCRRFWAKRWRLEFIPEAQAIHYGGASSANAPVRFYVEMKRADLMYWKKHHSRFSVACFFGLSCLHLVLRTVGYGFALGWTRQSRDVYRLKMKRSLAGLRWLVTKPQLCWSAAVV